MAQNNLTNGGNHDGSITLDETDVWNFSGTEGDKIFVRTGQLSGGTGFSPRIRILDDGGSQVGFATGAASSNTSMAAVELILPSTGDYTVEVDSALSGGTGTYRLHFFDLATSFTIPGGDHGGELTSGESRDGSITLGDLDIWTFQAAMSDRITVNVRQLSGGTTFAPKVRIYQANTLVGYAFDPAAITASEPEVALLAPGAGEFIAVVESGLEEGTGTYRMTFTLESGPFTYPTVAGEAIDNGAVNDGSISIPNEIDTWTFPVSAGDSVLVRLGETDNGTGLAPYLELFAPDGTSLMTDTAAADAWVETTAEVNGIYYVQVGDTDTGTNDLNDDTGSYRLEAIVLPESYEVSAGDEGGELTNGGLHEGTIHTGDIDTWTIQAEAGNTIQVRLGELDNGTGLYPHLALRAGDGTLLNTDSAAADGWVSTVATVAGNYFVQVTDWDTGTNDENDDTGSYKLEAVVTPGTFLVSPGDEGGELTLGELHEGAIHVGDLDTWTLQAEAGNTIIVRLGETDNGTGLYPYMELRGPDGALLDFDTSPADCWITLEAPATGTYFVQIADYDTGTNDENDDTGSYRLEAFVLPGDFNVSVADEGGAVIKGKLHEGVIHVGDMDVWTVQAEAGNTILARVGETDNGTGLNPYVELRGPDGGLLDSDTSITEGWVTTVADETGTYFVLIADYDTGTNDDNDDTGSYRLEVTVLPGNFEVSIGDEGGTLVNGSNYEGTIHVGDVDTWTLEANAGNTIMARVGEVDNGTGLNPYVSLSGPDGMLLVDNTNASDAAVTTVANATGTYYIQIADADTGTNDENDDTGSYRLESVVASNPISVSDGDEGGPLSNLAVNEGMLSLGDIDPWTFEAIDGDRIRLQLVTEGAYPLIKVYSPSGAEVASGQSNAAARTVNLEFLTENSGQFTVVVQSLLAGGMGAYDLTYQRYNGSFTIPEEDPSGWGGWTATGAVWQIGQPVAENGPGSYDGSALAGTFLAENYPYNSNGLLFSPPIFIPQNGLPQFTYHEWYATATSAHYGQVQIRRVGEEWSDVANTRVFGSGTTWAEKILDLTPYAGDTIQIGFRFVSNNFGTPLAGWFLDAVSLDIPLYTSIAPIDTVSIPIIPISWMGGSTDGLITGFDVYVRTDDGDWALWLEDTLQTSGVWIGEANRRYRFYVAARDSSGASIAPPEAGTTAQADTFVILPVRLTNVAHSTNASVSTVSFDLTGGTPGDAWNIRRASTMKGPWTNAGIVILDDNGNGQFADNNAPAPDIFYDAIKPD